LNPGTGTIGIAGPIAPAALAAHLDVPASRLPVGLGGVPVTSLATELLDRGHRVVVVTCSPDVTEDVVATGPRLELHVGPHRPRGRARDAFATERAAVRRALRRTRPDVVHAHWSYEYGLGALASEVPTLLTLHDWAPTILRYHRDAYRVVRLGMHAVALARARHLTAVSPYIGSAAARWRRPASVVPNGLPDRWFDATPRRLAVTSPTVVSVNSGFGERKNTTTLLRAFALLRRTQPTARLELIGDGHQAGGAAQRWAETRGLTDAVSFLGPLPYPRTMERVAAADVLVHPSLEESFGMTLIEAMAQGTPVVGGAASGAVPWVLDGGAAGALTDVTSADAIAATVRDVLADADGWQERSRRGFAHASANYRLSHVADRYLAHYDQVLRDAA
jgi:L-malate glycosyltransferase